jgi:hypothetical protein
MHLKPNEMVNRIFRRNRDKKTECESDFTHAGILQLYIVWATKTRLIPVDKTYRILLRI